MSQSAVNIDLSETNPHQATAITCPRCGSTALNKYGRLKSGKQRYICLVCNRQFGWPSSSKPIPYRPHCPACGREMHVYTRESDTIRFRCPDYPKCRSYMKINKGDESTK